MFNILNHRTILAYIKEYPEAEIPLKVWYQATKVAKWESLNDLKKDYSNASIVKDDRIIFNIKGNHFRLLVRISFRYRRIMIKWFGTHEEYNRIDVNTY